ncbi:hypothetical protein HN924_00360 [Candidatus Woesearchaeota archaeon]|jgi:hypothetical protein|nr:hypothetical protein [Candidatus Woesearchaeota archaeon]MBT7062404.1 hypothetical protein [Candidatus Woesearchaeota archaeon]MBT7402962.1 hypothetical protein [Candidatus Woesearchaeota archaeon]
MKKGASMYVNIFMALILGIIIAVVIYLILGNFNIRITESAPAIVDMFK